MPWTCIPYYGSDVEATLSAGNDLRHGLIGAGVYASHGYERSHVDGVWNTLKVLAGLSEYLKKFPVHFFVNREFFTSLCNINDSGSSPQSWDPRSDP